MFTIEYWNDYYNEDGNYQKFTMHRTSLSKATELAQELIDKGFERALILNTRTGKFINMVERRAAT